MLILVSFIIPHFLRDSKVVKEVCDKLVSIAREKDSELPQMNPTHLILLYYATGEGMYWHADDDVNDGDNDHPIVSLSLGNTCVFGYRVNGVEKRVDIESGDVLVWGGPQRMMQHSVLRVYMGTCPDFLP